MIKDNPYIDRYRDMKLSAPQNKNNGLFWIPVKSHLLMVIASDGLGWDHVSVSLRNRNPNWEEMCSIKDLFFDKEETVIQFHTEYVNNHRYCLHMWRKQDQEHELPPSILTGFKDESPQMEKSE